MEYRLPLAAGYLHEYTRLRASGVGCVLFAQDYKTSLLKLQVFRLAGHDYCCNRFGVPICTQTVVYGIMLVGDLARVGAGWLFVSCCCGCSSSGYCL